MNAEPGQADEAALKGQCQCGFVRYVVEGTVHRLNVCHCLDCQRQSGSAFGMSLVIDPTAFKLRSGELKTFLTMADSGREKTCAFCPRCGVRIYNVTNALMALKPGTLDDTSWLEPDGHYWTRSRQSWVRLPDDVPCFTEVG